MTAPMDANFLLIDGALCPSGIRGVCQSLERLHIEPLYGGTRWQALSDSGPILVAFPVESSLIVDLFRNTAQTDSASLMYSLAPVEAVARHLRSFIEPMDTLGVGGLLRFADPLVAIHWLASYERKRMDALLGPIDAWHVIEPHHTWEAESSRQWRSFRRVGQPVALLKTREVLAEAQLKALDKAARWRLKERLYINLKQNHADLLMLFKSASIEQWLEDRLGEAQQWGLFSERSAAIWVEYSLRWGGNVPLHESRHYQQWQASVPRAVHDSAEVLIQQMDDDCVRVLGEDEMRDHGHDT